MVVPGHPEFPKVVAELGARLLGSPNDSSVAEVAGLFDSHVVGSGVFHRVSTLRGGSKTRPKLVEIRSISMLPSRERDHLGDN